MKKLILILLSTFLNATGNPYINIKLTPIATSNNGKVLFQTYSDINTNGSYDCRPEKFGWLVVSANGIWDERVAYDTSEIFDDGCNYRDKKKYDAYKMGKVSIKNPDKVLAKLQDKYHFNRLVYYVPLDKMTKALELNPKQSCLMGHCTNKVLPQRSIEGLVSKKLISGSGKNLHPIFIYKGVALIRQPFYIDEDKTYYDQNKYDNPNGYKQKFNLPKLPKGRSYDATFIDSIVIFKRSDFTKPPVKSGKIKISGKISSEFNINILSVYSSNDKLCQVSNWNTGGYRDGITHIRNKAKIKDGVFYGTTHRHLKKNLCDWSLLYIDIEIMLNTKKNVHKYLPRLTIEPIYAIQISPSFNTYDKKISLQNGAIRKKLYCVRSDGIREEIRTRQKYIEPYMKCSTKTVGSGKKIYFDGNFSMLKDIKVDLFLKKDLYCFFGRRMCPAYTKVAISSDIVEQLDIESGFKKPVSAPTYKYTIEKTKRRKLYKALDLDSATYNPADAKKMLEQNNSLIVDSGYRLFQSSLAWSYAYNQISFSELKMLYKYGFNISKYQKEPYVSKKIVSLLKNIDIEPPYLNCDGYDYAALPNKMKQIYKDNNITLKNYYSYKPRKQRLLVMLGSDNIEEVKWLISHGYTPEKDELEWALVSALRKELKNPSATIKGYISLGANLKNYDVAFPLMDTMRERFDDIKTLRTLINAGVNINATDEYGQTIIYSMNYKIGDHYRSGCSVGRNIKTIREYIRLGMDLNHTDRNGNRPIDNERKSSSCNIEAFKKLESEKISNVLQ